MVLEMCVCVCVSVSVVLSTTAAQRLYIWTYVCMYSIASLKDTDSPVTMGPPVRAKASRTPVVGLGAEGSVCVCLQAKQCSIWCGTRACFVRVVVLMSSL